MAVIQGTHLIFAQLRSEPHWLVNDDDARRYGQAMVNVARHYPLKATQKAIDIFALMMAGAAIETPRIIRSVQLAKAGPARHEPPRGPAQVFKFTPNPAQHPSPPAPASPPPAHEPPSQPPAAVAPQAVAPQAVAPQDLAQGPPDGSGFGGDAA